MSLNDNSEMVRDVSEILAVYKVKDIQSMNYVELIEARKIALRKRIYLELIEHREVVLRERKKALRALANQFLKQADKLIAEGKVSENEFLAGGYI